MTAEALTAPPRAAGFDESFALLREGYAFIGNRCRRLGSDVFETRLLGQRTICMSGAESARVFYDPDRMQRRGAMPAPVKEVLLGEGGVQGLDGAAHRHRKAMFMDLMTPHRIDALAELTVEELRRAAAGWQREDSVVLLDAAAEVLCRAACRWAGVPLGEAEVRLRTEDMAAMVTGAASPSWRHLRGWQARLRTNAWAADLVEQVRTRELAVPDDLPLARIAGHRDLQGQPLPVRIAAVELLNLLRPTVAVTLYLTFAALALYRFPEALGEVAAGGETERTRFVQEVRRYYPFFPFVGAIVREPFGWRGYEFPAGRRVLLDLYGTNRDSRIWQQPDVFLPGRFAGVEPDAYQLVSQGGGDHHLHHRCAGEWITLALMQAWLRFLLEEVSYQVPEQDLRVPLNRFPALPNSRFVISEVRLKGA
ncbi:MAG TPA: cytochrome P450 [Pseudomonadales bacterium]